MSQKICVSVIFLFSLLTRVKSEGNCGVSQIQSASGVGCVDQIPMLVGGSNLAGWRSDAEIFIDNEFVPIGDFPYLIDAPYGFFAGPEIGVVICGGRNWADDIVEKRCWQYNQCTQEWIHVTDMPIASSGGVGVPIQDESGSWSLWIIGGGDGVNALPYILMLTPRQNGTSEISWEWTQKQDLNTARYGHCAVYHHQLNKIYVLSGRNDAEVLDSVEIIDPVSGTIEVVDWTMATARWGMPCQYFENEANEGMIAVMGGMDSLFIPHSDFHLLKIGEPTNGGYPDIPWSASGHIGVSMGGHPAFFGGFSLLGFQKRGAIFQDGEWEILDARMESSRVSGLAVAVPGDILDYC